MGLDCNQKAFLTLVKAGLWEYNVRLAPIGSVDFEEVYRIAQEQSVTGIVTAGLEYVVDVKPSKDILLTYIGETLQLEQRNKSMNEFIEHLYDKLNKEGIHTILIKGQGIAQCYKRPLWRTCGDVDLLMDECNYQKAKELLTLDASIVDIEDKRRLHLGMTINSWLVELHGSMRTLQLPLRFDKIIDEIQYNTIYTGSTRVWQNKTTNILLPSPDNDFIFIFGHIMQHYFGGGIGLRQICDLCRLIWNYHKIINISLLEERISKMGMMTEWKALAHFMVENLGLPADIMPLYDSASRWKRKSDLMLFYIMRTGTLGHNRNGNFRRKYPLLIWKAISSWKYLNDMLTHLFIFPLDSVRVIMRTFQYGVANTLSKNV